MKYLYRSMMVLSMVNILAAWACWAQEPSSLSLSLDQTKPMSMVDIDHFMGLDDVLAFDHNRMFFKEQSGRDVYEINFPDAVDLGIKNNLTSTEAVEKINEALADKLKSMSSFLPHLDGVVSQERTSRENLAAQGFNFPGSGSYIGPYNTFDARLQLTQSIIDFNAQLDFKAGANDVNTAEYEKELSHQKVVLLVAMDYLDALRSQADFKAAQANMELSKKLLKLSKDQIDAGLANSVDVARASTQLAQDELTFAQTKTNVHDAYLQLQRDIGLSYEGALQLMNDLEFVEEKVPNLSDALSIANQERLDMRIDGSKIKSSHYRLNAAKAEYLPKIDFLANYGLSGIEPQKNDRSTGSLMVRATIPLFEGGQTAADVKEAKSQEKQLELNFEDLKQQVEEDVRKALWTLETDLEAVNAAGHVVALAENELDLATDSFKQGLGDNIGVLNAQNSLAQARDEYVVALTQYHAARINYYFALGNTNMFYLKNLDQHKPRLG